MEYNLEIEVRDEILWVTATGKRTVETLISMAQDILAACVERDRKKVLLDVLDLQGHLKGLDSYNIPAEYFPTIRDRSVITHCAVIDPSAGDEAVRFFENVAVNRGFNFRIFSNSDEALDWLKR